MWLDGVLFFLGVLLISFPSLLSCIFWKQKLNTKIWIVHLLVPDIIWPWLTRGFKSNSYSEFYSIGECGGLAIYWLLFPKFCMAGEWASEVGLPCWFEESISLFFWDSTNVSIVFALVWFVLKFYLVFLLIYFRELK